jgi:hypothetical protein
MRVVGEPTKVGALPKVDVVRLSQMTYSAG